MVMEFAQAIKRLAGGLLVLCILVVAGNSLADETNARLDIYWIDVEGGAATLLVSPSGESLLIDTGLPGDRDPARINKLAREVAGLKKIDHLVVTHYDLDHYGGTADLAKLIPIGRLYDTGLTDKDKKRVGEAYVNAKVGARITLKPGATIKLKQHGEGFPPVIINCLGARQMFIKATDAHKKNTELCASATQKNPDKSQNANSIVLRISLGKFDFLDAADLTWNLEGQLVCPKNLVGPVDVFQVNHHGLGSSNNPVLIKSIEPTIAVMNNGDRKGCATSTVAALRSTKSIKAVYQGHKNLSGDDRNAPDEYVANKDSRKQCKGHYIKLSVDPLGKSYTVTIPATKHEKTYQSK
jgi:competence protein ComEC